MAIDLLRLKSRVRRKQMHPEHLTDAEISAFVDQHLTPEERAAVAGHIVSCSSCRAAVADVSRISHAYQTAPADAALNPRITRTRVPQFVIGLVAASVAIVSISTFALRRERSEAVESTRATMSDDRSIIAIQPDPSREQPGEVRFVWRSIGADVYRLSILDKTGAPVFQRDVRDTVFMLPPAVSLDRTSLYFWRVDAIADGQVVSTGARELKLRR